MNIVIMILLISLLILVHELGHFISARVLGIKVEKFGFGLPFGPVIFKTKYKDVEILVHALLLGGYVAFPDDDPDNKEKKNPEDLFINKPVWKRVIVVCAGVVANMICAYLLVVMTASIWHKLPSGRYNIFISEIVAEKQASVLNSGLRIGDQVYKLNGVEIFQPFQLSKFAKESKRHDGYVSEEIYNDRLSALKDLNSDITDVEQPVEKGRKVILPELKDEAPLVFDKAAMMGMAKVKYDKIKLDKQQIALRDKIQGQKEYIADGEATLSDIAKAYADTQKPMKIIVLRDGKEIELNTIYSNEKGLVGVKQAYSEVVLPSKTPSQILKASWNYTSRITDLTLLGLGQLFTGQVPVKELHGIVAITKVGGDMIEKHGLYNGFLLTAIISINLAVMNVLPIPALDGGHLMFLILEKIQGKPLNEELVGKISNFFFILLIILMLLIVFNDVFALLTKKI